MKISIVVLVIPPDNLVTWLNGWGGPPNQSWILIGAIFYGFGPTGSDPGNCLALAPQLPDSGLSAACSPTPSQRSPSFPLLKSLNSLGLFVFS